MNQQIQRKPVVKDNRRARKTPLSEYKDDPDPIRLENRHLRQDLDAKEAIITVKDREMTEMGGKMRLLESQIDSMTRHMEESAAISDARAEDQIAEIKRGSEENGALKARVIELEDQLKDTATELARIKSGAGITEMEARLREAESFSEKTKAAYAQIAKENKIAREDGERMRNEFGNLSSLVITFISSFSNSLHFFDLKAKGVLARFKQEYWEIMDKRAGM